MFKLYLEYKPTGDQPKAIEYLSKGIEEGKKFQKISFLRCFLFNKDLRVKIDEKNKYDLTNDFTDIETAILMNSI